MIILKCIWCCLLQSLLVKYKHGIFLFWQKRHHTRFFQTYNLLENLNVEENVKVGSKLGKKKTDINEIIKAFCEAVKE